MKTIIVHQINVISVIKNTVVLFVITGLVIGFIMGFLLTPANMGLTTLLKGLISTTLFMGAYGLSASVVLIFFSILYNLLSRFTGGLEFKIREKQ
ncbi:MAG: hypothetical protein MJA84_02725 [Firmicutes bacterium]|nr:hypothetical protein [Bacillota bacterium]